MCIILHEAKWLETFLNHLAGDKFKAESAGFEPTKINPIVVEVMKEIGFDIANNQTKSVFDFFKQGRQFDYVSRSVRCSERGTLPDISTCAKRLNWSFEDPASFTGTYEEILERTRLVRDKIKFEVENFINEFPSLT